MPYFKILKIPSGNLLPKELLQSHFHFRNKLKHVLEQLYFLLKLQEQQISTCQKGKFQGITPKITPFGA
jgi:hypothetical protein